MDKKQSAYRILMTWMLLSALLASACSLFSRPIQPTSKPTSVLVVETTPTAGQPFTPTPGVGAPTPTIGKPFEQNPLLIFAPYRQPPSQTSPTLPGAENPPGWDTVYNPFILSQEQIDRLRQEGFAVAPGVEKEFFTVYEKARYANVPIFVTSDALLHSYHLLFDKLLRAAETEHFIPLLDATNKALLQRSDQIYQEVKGTPWADNALRTVAYFGVAAQLLDSSVQVPSYASELASQELALINAAGGIQPSPLFPYLESGEDYTQYIPRGHYTRSDALKAYFKSMMWYGRMTFRLKGNDPNAGINETRSALFLILALKTSQVNGEPALNAWMDLYTPTVFFVGRSDDLTVLQFIDVADQVYGKDVDADKLVDDAKLSQFIDQANQLPPPQILGMVIQDTDDVEAATKGLRFMGQRFVPDAYIFRQLIYRNVGTRENRRGLPMGLDLLAAMGSERAYQILDAQGETSYENYPQQMDKVRGWLAVLTTEQWTETLYNSWLYSFYPLLGKPVAGLPYFMQNQSWQDKQLNTVLGSWAELKHDTILYAKQVYAELGGGPPAPEPVPPKGYVEPVPEFYARLAALTDMTLQGLSNRNLLSDPDRSTLQSLYDLAGQLQRMAEKELRGEALTDEEFHIIRYIGGQLEQFVMAAADTDATDPFARKYMDEQPQAAVIADVATDPGGAQGPVVLEVGVGRINEIHAVVPVVNEDGSIFWEVAKGGVFSYYEFPWPAPDRLTDEQWRSMLDEGKAPALPQWTESFRVARGEYGDLQSAVFEFEKAVTDVFWYIDSQIESTNSALGVFQTELDKLRKDQQYEGRQLVGFSFLSFDMQTEKEAVVTVRETWQDELYPGGTPESGGVPVARRGPYSWIATYKLQYVTADFGTTWQVVGVSYDQQPPDWVK